MVARYGCLALFFLVLVDEVLKYEVLWYSSVGMAGVGK